MRRPTPGSSNPGIPVVTDPPTSTVRFRRADLSHPADVSAVTGLVAEFQREEDGFDLAWAVREGLGPHFRRRASFVLLAEIEEVPVGVLVAQRNLSSFQAVDACNIHDVFVVESARGRGIARGLMQVAESMAEALGCLKMTLEVNTDNVAGLALYRSLGYDVPEGDLPPGATLFVRKPLDGDPAVQTKTNTT